MKIDTILICYVNTDTIRRLGNGNEATSEEQRRTSPHKDFSRRERLMNKKVVLGSVSAITKIKQGIGLDYKQLGDGTIRLVGLEELMAEC